MSNVMMAAEQMDLSPEALALLTPDAAPAAASLCCQSRNTTYSMPIPPSNGARNVLNQCALDGWFLWKWKNAITENAHSDCTIRMAMVPRIASRPYRWT